MAVESGTAILSKDLRIPPEDLCGLVPLEDFRQSQLDDLHFYLAEIDDSLNNYADGIPKEIIHSRGFLIEVKEEEFTLLAA